MGIIDNRIVKMTFDNKQFESSIGQTINSLKNLDKSLDIKTDSFGEIQKSADKLKLNPIAEGINKISNSFSNLGIIGVTTLVNLTNSAVNFSKNLAHAVTVKPIFDGFREYETKMGAIQTILTNTRSKGTKLEDVNNVLADLNLYADKTIYNFAEMARNIGTFTAAGIDLERSAVAIKGIANLAAGSGSTSQQASTAMYQLSQALAAGSVKLQDWNSVVNAGMGGELFQNALKETAKEMGVVVKESIPFRESLKDGWLSSEVLVKTLEKFSKDQTLVDAATKVKTITQLWDTMQESVQSGWGVTWEYIIGNKDQATELLTAISQGFENIVGPSADARNEALKFWNQNGGRDAIIKALANSFKALIDIIKPLKLAFKEVFPPKTGKDLVELSKNIEKFTEKLKPTALVMGQLKRTAKGFFSIFSIGIKIIKPFVSLFSKVLNSIFPVTGSLLSASASLGDFITRVDKAIVPGNTFYKIMDNIGNGIVYIIEKVKSLKNLVSSKDFSNNHFSIFIKTIKEKTSNLSKINPFDSLVKGIKSFSNALKNGFQPDTNMFIKLLVSIGNVFKRLTSIIVEGFKNFNISEFITILNKALFGGVLFSLNNFMKSLSSINPADGISGIFSKLFGFKGNDIGTTIENLKGILSGLKDTLTAYQNEIKSKTLKQIAVAIAILAGSLFVISSIEPGKMQDGIVAIGALFGELLSSMAIFNKISSKSSITNLTSMSVVMLALSISIAILSSSLVAISKLDWEGVKKGLISIGTISATLVISAKALSSSNKKILKGATGLIALALALKIMTKSLIEVSNIDYNSLKTGLLGLGGMLVELSLFINLTNKSSNGIGKSFGFVLIAEALKIMTKSLIEVSNIDYNSLKTGLLGLGGMLAELSLFVKMTSGAKGMITTSTGLVIMGVAIKNLVTPLKQLGNMKYEQLKTGLIALAGSLTAISVAMRLLPKGSLIKSASMVIISKAIVSISTSLKDISTLSYDQLKISLIALAGSLTAISVTLIAMGNNAVLKGSAALLIASLAIKSFSNVLKNLGEMKIGDIGKALLALVGVFAVLGGSALLLAPLTPVILSLSASIAILGAGILAMGVGIGMFAAGLATLAAAGTGAGIAIASVITTIGNMIPFIFEKMKESLILFGKVIGEAAPSIVKGGVILILEFLKGINVTIPEVINTFAYIIKNILKTIEENLPEILQSGLNILTELLKGISNNIGEIVKVAVDIVINFIKAITSKLPEIIETGFQLIIKFIEGMASSVKKNGPKLVSAIFKLFSAIISTIIEVLINSVKLIFDTGKKLVDSGLLSGIKDMIYKVPEEFVNILNKVVEKVTGFVGDLFEAGKNIAKGLADGIKGAVDNVVDSAKDLAGSAINAAKDTLGIHSPSRVFKELGKYTTLGFINGLNSLNKDVENSFDSLSIMAEDSISSALHHIQSIIDDDLDGANELEITPVVDLNRLHDDLEKIKGLNPKKSIQLSNSLLDKIGGIKNNSEKDKPEKNITFVQNNYSPESLSRIEIYRQTNNQISRLKEVINND